MNTRLSGASYHDVRITKCNESGRVPDRMSACCARRGHCVGRAFEAVPQRDMSRSEIDEKLRDEIRRYLFSALFER